MITRFARSVRTRLTLIASITMALVCLVVNSLVLYGVHNASVDLRTNEVVTAALRVVHLVKRGNLPAIIPTDVSGVQVINTVGQVVSSSPKLAGDGPMATIVPDPDNASRTQVVCGMTVFGGSCQIVAAFRVYQQDGDWMVYAAGTMPPWYVQPAVLAFLIGLSLGLVALTWFVTSRTVAKTLAPVDAIRSKLADITATDLGLRVPVPEDYELHALAETANATLDRLEQAVEQQRRFASDASHDLRSPITAMRAQIEEAMLYPEEADWERTGEALLGSLDRLQAIVGDLLVLAKLDAGAPTTSEPVDLAKLATDETARERSKRVRTSLETGVIVSGDRLRLARLVTNLLDNAERHAERAVTIKVGEQDGWAVLEVLDDGAGIAPDKRDVVFQRFTRLPASRRRDAGGTGLGLPIAREIAHAHGGTLTLEDSERGARFVLRLPLRKA